LPDYLLGIGLPAACCPQTVEVFADLEQGGVELNDNTKTLSFHSIVKEPKIQLTVVVGPAPSYEGPVFEGLGRLEVKVGELVNLAGSRLGSIASLQIAGVEVSGLVATSNSIQFLMPDVQIAQQDLVALSSYGALTVQGALVVQERQQPVFSSWTKKVSDSQVKLYAKNVVGAGKVQFFFNGKEIAWVRAIDATDPKLRIAAGSDDLVRTVELNDGKNRFEIKLNGVRVWRATYVPKG
jgi:hypothetical protein